jgi:hypothetical protein
MPSLLGVVHLKISKTKPNTCQRCNSHLTCLLFVSPFSVQMAKRRWTNAPDRSRMYRCYKLQFMSLTRRCSECNSRYDGQMRAVWWRCQQFTRSSKGTIMKYIQRNKMRRTSGWWLDEIALSIYGLPFNVDKWCNYEAVPATVWLVTSDFEGPFL